MNIKYKSILVTLLLGFIYYYFLLPPINLSSPEFYSFLGFLLVVFAIMNSIEKASMFFISGKVPRGIIKDNVVIVSTIVIFSLLTMLINLFMSPLFLAKTYSKRITVNTDKDFITDIKQVDATRLPVIDKDSSIKLGDRVMGRMSDLVSQFTVSNLYTQINYKNEIVRVTPLEYSDFFKVLANSKKGIEGYITVNSVTGVADLIRLDDGLKYMDSAIFSKDLSRKLRFSYPTKVFETKSFELDDSGNPFWIIPTVKYYGIGIREEIEGAIIFNPINGESTYYDVKDVPSWVDHVYPANLIIEQVDQWGTYKGGFFNSIFGQKDVVVTTEGYNYTTLGDDVYLYTGVTSVLADESNIGFIMTNLRTKETNFYSVPGAEEFSAMSSARGQVQEKSFTPTFPLLVNINNKPTYFISLKDNAGLVKMYAFVDVADYQKVVVTDSSKGIEAAITNYIGNDPVDTDKELIYKDITVKSVTSAYINGYTYYYIKDTNNNNYKVALTINENILPFLKVEDKINIGYVKLEDLTIILELK